MESRKTVVWEAIEQARKERKERRTGIAVQRWEASLRNRKRVTLEYPAQASPGCGCVPYKYCDEHVREIAAEDCTCSTLFDGFEPYDSGCPACDAKAQLESEGGDDELPF